MNSDQVMIIIGLLFLFVLLVIAAENRQKNYLRKKEIDDYVEAVEKEFLRNKQIIDESLEIMYNTNNLKVLFGRWGEVVYIETLIRTNAEKYNISFKDYDADFLSKLDDYVNFHLVRIFEHKKEKYISKINELRRLSSIDNHTSLLLEEIISNKKLLRPSKNKTNCEKSLDNIYYDIQELYSQRTINL